MDKLFKIYTKNMDLLLKNIIQLFKMENENNSLEQIWILSSTPALGNLTLRIFPIEDNKKSNRYKELQRLIIDLSKSSIKIKLACFAIEEKNKNSIINFYDSLKNYLKHKKPVEISNQQYNEIAELAKKESIDIIKKLDSLDNVKYKKLENKPDINIWACKRKLQNQDNHAFEAIFYLAEIEEPLMNFRAFYVKNNELAKFLINIVNNKFKNHKPASTESSGAK